MKREPRSIEPRAYRFLPDFASDNELAVIDPTNPEGSADYCPVPGATQGPEGQDAPPGRN